MDRRSARRCVRLRAAGHPGGYSRPILTSQRYPDNSKGSEFFMPDITIDPAALDGYISGLFAPEDDALRQTIADMEAEKLPSINVSASEGKLLHLLARMVGAKRVLEIETL